VKHKQHIGKENDKVIIDKSISDIKKIPKHLGVILNVKHEKDVDLSKLVQLISYSLHSGINFISFYDFRGEAFSAAIALSSF
jgi:hypothetical protein